MKNYARMAAFLALVSLIGFTGCATSSQVALVDEPRDFANFMAFGNQAMAEHEWAVAQKFFLAAHELEPENAVAVYRFAEADLLGYTYTFDDLARSRRMIEQALASANPDDARRLLDIQARIALREGRLADAQSALDEIQAIPQAAGPDVPRLLQETEDALAQIP